MLAYTQVKLKRIVLLDTPAGAFKKGGLCAYALSTKIVYWPDCS